jgi:cell division protein YceG involved in septum cleavage
VTAGDVDVTAVPAESGVLEGDRRPADAPVEPAALEEDPGVAQVPLEGDAHTAPVEPAPETAAPVEPDPEEMPIAPPEPADPPVLPPEPTLAPELVEAEPGRAPVDPAEAMEPPPVEFEPEAAADPVQPVEPEAGLSPHPVEVQAEEAVAPEPVPAAEPIGPDPGVEAVPGDPDAAGSHAAEAYDRADPPEPEPATGFTEREIPAEAQQPGDEQLPAAHDQSVPEDADAAPLEPLLDAPPDPALLDEAGATAADQDLARAHDERDPAHDEHDPAHDEPALAQDEHASVDGPGYPIPGIPEPPGPEPRPGLPEPPRRLQPAEATPMRRAFRRSGDGAAAAGAVGLASEGRSADGGRGREGHSRWIAVLALLAIGIVVAVLVYSLKTSSSSHPTAKAPAEVKVLIPEGKTRQQIAQIASSAGLRGSYRRAARRSPLLNPTQYGAPKTTRTLEGFLFPATYDMNKGAPSERLVEEQVTAFQENFSAEYAKRARELGLTSYELLTVASMIEREAQVPADRAKIAAVIYNRLKAGIPLGIDATIYYAVENAENIPTYTKELTSSQLQIDSAYNTRLHKGLPPTPISNPGVASIQAAARPAHAGYLYYVAGADGCGEQVFSSTEAKFNEDVAAYEAAKRANGGHLPACKHH